MKDLTTEEIIKDLLNIVEDLIITTRKHLEILKEQKVVGQSQDDIDWQLYQLNKIEQKVKKIKKELT